MCALRERMPSSTNGWIMATVHFSKCWYIVLIKIMSPFLLRIFLTATMSLFTEVQDLGFATRSKQEAQLPQRNSASAAHMEDGELGPQPTLPTPPLTTPMHMVESETRNKLTSTKHTLRWIGQSRSFKVILIGASRNPERCVLLCCRNVQFMPTLFLKLRKIRQRENGKFVDFNDPSHVWRRLSKKRLRISTNDLYCQKLESLTYILPLIVWINIY